MRSPLPYVLLLALIAAGISATGPDALEAGFRNPPPEARLRCYWWWLNGNTNEATITRDLEEMKAKGYGGALLVDAGGAEQGGHRPVPAGPMFGSPEWRALYRHALKEAARLNLEISLNIQSGWNLGGPNVKPEQASKLLTFSRVTVSGPAEFRQQLPQPPQRHGFYRDVAVLAYPLSGAQHRPIRLLEFKSAAREFGMSAPKTKPLLEDDPAVPGEEDAHVADVRDLSARMQPDGTLAWSVPKGNWEILRAGYTCSGARVSTSSDTWQGLAIDYLDRTAFKAFWRENVDPLIDEAKPYIGKTLRYLVTDSWEVGGINWTGGFRDAYRRRRGYDPLPYLPIVAGRILDSRDTSNRFLNDLRRTVADLVISEHYGVFAEMAGTAGLGIHPESGGPHGAPIDALETLGISAFPQTEFWAQSYTHRTRDDERFFVKEAASAAHTYGKTLVGAEGMTSIGPQWEESIWDNLKPSFDQAACEGLNRLIWHTFTSSPKEMGLPGQEYFAGTHLNPNVTWWNQAGAFIGYINRVQFLLQQGRPVADVLYYYGDQAPNFVQLKSADPALVLPGYDYDVADEEVLTHRLGPRDYRVIVLPETRTLSAAAAQAIKRLVTDGAVVVGSRPVHATGLEGDGEVSAVAASLWSDCSASQPHRIGAGAVYCGDATREVLHALGVVPDFESPSGTLDYIHRRVDGADIYFIRNTRAEAFSGEVTLRSRDRTPELWRPDTAAIEAQRIYDFTSDGRTRVPLTLEPYGSMFVVFRRPSGPHSTRATESAPAEVTVIDSPWTVSFTPGWGAPASVVFPRLESWTENADPGIKYYSGTATYSTHFSLTARQLEESRTVDLDLGEVRELAQVRLNGRDLGVLWKKPFSVSLRPAARLGTNELEVAVTNLWPNRLIGDQRLPPEQRKTHTNIAKFRADSPLMPSGLMGPVQLSLR